MGRIMFVRVFQWPMWAEEMFANSPFTCITTRRIMITFIFLLESQSLLLITSCSSIALNSLLGPLLHQLLQFRICKRLIIFGPWFLLLSVWSLRFWPSNFGLRLCLQMGHTQPHRKAFSVIFTLWTSIVTTYMPTTKFLISQARNASRAFGYLLELFSRGIAGWRPRNCILVCDVAKGDASTRFLQRPWRR